MVKVLITLTMALVGLLGNAQVSETREVSGFTGIEAKDGIEVVYTQGSETSVAVETTGNMSDIVTERKGKTLKIYRVSEDESVVRVSIVANGVRSFKAGDGATIRVTNELTGETIAISLSDDAQFNGNIKSTSKISVNTSSGASFEGKITTNSFDGHFRNGSNAKIWGYTRKATLRCESGAACMAGRLRVDSVSAHAKNKSAIAVTVTESIIAGSDDTSSVKYYGSPATTIIDANSYALRTN